MKKSLAIILAFGLALSFAATGCKPKSKNTVTKLPPGSTGNAAGNTGAGGGTDNTTVIPPMPDPASTNIGGTGTGTDLPGRQGLEGMIPDREIFKANTVYFEFDRSAVRQAEQSKIQAVAKALQERPSAKVQIEGHCDERGTEEYNRSLGERRALAIREYLINLGIGGDRVFTMSFGEDKPAVQGHSEEAWAKNRRGEFILYTRP